MQKIEHSQKCSSTQNPELGVRVYERIVGDVTELVGILIATDAEERLRSEQSHTFAPELDPRLAGASPDREIGLSSTKSDDEDGNQCRTERNRLTAEAKRQER